MRLPAALLLVALLAAPMHADDVPPKPSLDAALRVLIGRMADEDLRLQQRVIDLGAELERVRREQKTCVEARTT